MSKCTLIAGSGQGAAGLPFVVYALGQIVLLLLYGLVLTIRWERVRSAPQWVRLLFLDFSSDQHQRRSTQVFFWDCATKQFGGFALLSLLTQLSMPWLQARAGADDGCDVLWWSVALQATLGTVLVRLLKLATTCMLAHRPDLSVFGEYKGCGTVIQKKIVAKQLAVWLVLVLLMKLAVVGLQLGIGSHLFSLRRFLGDQPQMELFVVVFLTPAVLNTYMFLAFDTMNSCSQLPWQKRKLEFEGAHTKPELKEGIDSEGFMIQCCQDGDFAHYYGFSSFGDDDRPTAAVQFHQAHEGMLREALEVQRKLVVVFNERLDLGCGGKVQQWQFLGVCRTNPELLKLFNSLDTMSAGVEGIASSMVVYGDIRKDGKKTMATWREEFDTSLPPQPVVTRALTRTTLMAQLRHWISPAHILQWVSFFQDVFSPQEDPRREAVRFWHMHCFFHTKSPDLAQLRSRLERFVREENGGIQEPDVEPEGLPENLPKWGGEEHGSAFTDLEVDPRVARFMNIQGGSFLAPGARQSETDLSMWDHNEEVARRMLDGAVKPSLNHSLGPAVQVARLGVAWNTMAWFLMPWVAQSTMDCSPLNRGFADHIIPSWGVLFDVCCLLVFIVVSQRLQKEIMRYLVLGQVCWQSAFKLELPFTVIDFSQYRYNKFLWFMQVLTALNLLNTWTNAEVFGRVLTTVNWCSDRGGTEVTRTWMKVVRSSGTLGWVDPHSNFLVVTSLVYCLIFFQAIFAVVFSCPLDSQVTYNVGEPYEGHHGYRTLWEPTAGTSHKAVVQTLAALVPYEAVIFQDATCGLLEMDERLKLAKRFREPPPQDAYVLQPRGSLVAHEIIGYLRELQAQLQRFLAKLILVGFLQNALQTKLQITFLSLDYNRKGKCDAVFCLGIVGNLLGFFMSAVETWDLVKLAERYYSHRKEILSLLSERELKFEQSRELIMRLIRIRGGFVMGLLFAVIYILFLIYLLINLAMIWVCESHIWNLSLDPRKGCFDPDAVHVGSG